jgi:outer membrane protein TolC
MSMRRPPALVHAATYTHEPRFFRMSFSIARLRLAGALAASALAALPLGAQQRTADTVYALSLADALLAAELQSEDVRIAQAGVLRARGDQYRARSQYLPQINASAQYTRTLRTVFEQAAGPPPPEKTFTPPEPIDPDGCASYLAPAGATPDQRIFGLEQSIRCNSGFDPFAAFSNLPFGRPNQWDLGITVSQNLFAGGRIIAQNTAANAGRRSAEIQLASQRAQVQLTVTQAYYDAVLAERLLAIAQSSLVQTENALRQTQLARNVGNTSEFELLRAQVTRDNQRPVAIQAKTQRDLAVLRLKQLLNLPLDDSLRLTTDLQDTMTVAPVRLASNPRRSAPAMEPDTSTEDRAGVRQAEENVRAQKSLLKVARAQRIPALTVSTNYGKQAFPNSGVPNWNQFFDNWTVAVGMRVPLFTGGRIRGDELVAKANVMEAEQQYQQTRELAALDARTALAALEEAEAGWVASLGTSEQATRAYSIAEVRYREGISTQLELAQSRILLQQSLANRATAARDLQVARVRLALLRDLPITAGSGAVGTRGRAGAASQSIEQGGTTQQQTQQPQPQATADLTGTGTPGGGNQ